MPRFGLRRSRVAVLAVAAMVASVLAIGASSSPLSATAGAPSHKATYSACVGAATDASGLSGVAGTTHESAINCLFHYGITKGTSTGAYNNGGSVTRWHMALFMTRAASAAGVTLGAGTSQGFTDIDRLTTDVQTAINQAVTTGLTRGRTSTRFDPHAAVTRAEMAIWIDNFLQRATPGPGGTAGAEAVGAVRPDANDGNFPDLQSVNVATYNAVRRLYELGVTEGTTATTYSPSAPVTRAQMASFITRALGHTMARPVGISVQADASSVERDGDNPKLLVSIRDANYRPAFEKRVNVMVVETKNIADAFNSDGTCDTSGDLFKNADACTIAAGFFTNLAGNYEYQDVIATSDVADYTVYAWTADSAGTTYDRDLHGDDTATATVSITEDADAYSLTTSLADGAEKAKFGTRVNFIIQVVDTDDMSTGVPANPISLADKKFTITEDVRNSDGTGSTTTKEVTTDANGRITLSHALNDPSGPENNPVGTVSVAVTESGGLAAAGGDRIVVQWDDDAPEATSLTLELAAGKHKQAPASATDSVRNTVRATVLDQYGVGVPNSQVTFSGSNADGGIGSEGDTTTPENQRKLRERQRSTGSNGVVTYAYARSGSDSTDSFVDTITASATGVPSASEAFVWTEPCQDLTKRGQERGATCRTPNEGADFLPVRIFDADAREIIWQSGAAADDPYWVIRYDSTDRFNTGDADASTTPATISSFEEFAAENEATLRVRVQLLDPSGLSVLHLSKMA